MIITLIQASDSDCVWKWLHIQGRREGVSRRLWKPLKFLGTLLKPETYSGISMHKYWNRNLCIGMPHCHFIVVNIRCNEVLRVGLRNALPLENRSILSNITVKHSNRAIIFNDDYIPLVV